MRRFRTDAFGMHDDPTGDWVAHAQAEYEITKRDARIAELEAAVDAEIDSSSTQSDRFLAVIDAHEKRIAELEAAIDKLAQCKGRFHTEANFKALIAVREKNLHK